MFVVFATEESARNCVRDKPAFPRTNDSLTNIFIPKLVVTMKNVVEAQEAEAAEKEFAKVQKEALEAAATGQLHTSSAAPAALPLAPQPVTKFLQPKHTCVVRNTRAGWAQIKSLIGELCSCDDQLSSNDVALVNVEGTTGYVVMRSSHAAERLVEKFRAVTAHFAAAQQQGSTTTFGEKVARIDKLLQAVPSLQLLSGDEEEGVMKKYPQWVAPRVSKKKGLNAGIEKPGHAGLVVGDKRPRNE